LIQKRDDGRDFFFDTIGLNDFVAFESRRSIDESLINKVGVLLEAKSFENLSLYTLMVTVARSCSESNTELLFNKLCEVL